MGTKTYDPSEVSVIIGGRIVKSWNTVSIVRDEDAWSFATGTQGETTRTKNLNKMGRITLVCPQGSEDNLAISALQAAGALIPCMIKDNSGNSIAIVPEGTLIKPADQEFGKESGEREWVVVGDVPDPVVVGGN